MTDLKTIGGSFFALSLANNDIQTDDGLETAIALSLFTHKRVTAEEKPEGVAGRGGFWGDQFLAAPMGSKLWLLDRSKETPEILNLAEQYADEAIAWVVDDGLASRASVSATFDKGAIVLSVSIERGEDSQIFKFSENWKGLKS